MMRYLIICITILFYFFADDIVIAQNRPLERKNGYSLTGIGYGAMLPKLKNGADASSWNGLLYRIGGAEISFFTGNVSYKNDSLKSVTNPGYKAGVGFHAPISSLALGKRVFGIKGYVLSPYLAGDIGTMGIGKSKSISISLAPGYALQVPFIGIQIQLNATYNFFDKFTEVDQLMGRSEQERNIIKGLVFYPSVHVYLDGLVDLLPVIGLKGTTVHNTKQDEYLASGHTDYVVDGRGNAWYITTPYDENILKSGEWKKGVVKVDMVKSIWGIKPLLSVKAPSYDKGNSFMYGLGLSYRKGVIGLDVAYEQGSLGARAPLKPGIGNGSYPFHNYYKIAQTTAGLGIDVIRIIALSLMQDKDEGMKGKALFERFIIGWRFGQSTMQNVVIDSIPANSLSSENVKYSFIDKAKTSGIINYPYASYEFGTVIVSAEFLSKKQYHYASGVRWGVSCIFPVGAIGKVLFGKKKS